MNSCRLLVCVLVGICALYSGSAVAQIIINEVLYDPVGEDRGREVVELKNVGSSTVDLAGWELCTTFIYSGMDAFAGYSLAPGQILVVHMGATGVNDGGNVYLPDFPPMFPGIDGTLSNFADDMSLYDCTAAGCFGGFGPLNRMVDFVQWGVTGQSANEDRHNLAADTTRTGGALWSPAPALDFAPLVAEGQSIAFDGADGGGGELTLGTDYIAGQPTIGADNGFCVADNQCSDGVPCTDDRCIGGACQFPPNHAMCPSDGLFCNGAESCSAQGCISSGSPCSAGQMCNEASDACTACQVNTDCTDNNVCTLDACTNGACTFVTIAGCCQTASDCNDSNACTIDNCSSNSCVHGAVAGCRVCTSAAACSDGNPCTEDLCASGVCMNVNNSVSCNDGDVCTADDRCTNSECTGEPIPDCCTAGAECDDEDSCTQDVCNDNRCAHELIAGCLACTTDTDCEDDDVCTTDLCDSGFCASVTNESPCDDLDPCTEDDLCANGVCEGRPATDCCATEIDCDDDDDCTLDECIASRCRNTVDENCAASSQDVPSGEIPDDAEGPDAESDDTPPPRTTVRACGLFGLIPSIGLILGLCSIRRAYWRFMIPSPGRSWPRE